LTPASTKASERLIEAIFDPLLPTAFFQKGELVIVLRRLVDNRVRRVGAVAIIAVDDLGEAFALA